MTQILFSKGSRYIKAYTEDSTGSRSAIAFFDKQRGYWLEASSWSKPGTRLSALSAHLNEQLHATT